MLSKGQGVRGYGNFSGTGIQTFLGIPYALPPTGDRRFLAPSPVSPWRGIKDALHLSPRCLQSIEMVDAESEDCLYLNIFTPDIKGSNPVMVWIHGGGFSIGSGNYWDGTRLSGKGVVVVTFNYRLSVLGFGSTGDDVMPGNYGLLDQVLALKWVQQNINVFGGDPRRVTVFGNSAGSTSISLHLLSPLSEGLFHRAIMESGSAYSLWGVHRKEALTSPREATRRIASALNCSSENSTLLRHCLTTLDAHAIIKQANVLVRETNTAIIFVPCVENSFGFLPDLPENLFDAGKFQNIETMSGSTSGEAALVIYNKYPNATGISKSEFKEGLLDVFTWCSFKNERRIVDLLADFYLHNVTGREQILDKLYEAANDLFQIPPLIQLTTVLNRQKLKKKHYLFQFDYVPRTIRLPKKLGLPHSKERAFVFYSDANTSIFTFDDMSMNLSSNDIKMADRVQTMWTNFAKHDTPLDANQGEITSWPDYTSQTPLMAHLDALLHYTPYTKKPEVGFYWDFLRYVNGSERLRFDSVAIGFLASLIILTNCH